MLVKLCPDVGRCSARLRTFQVTVWQLVDIVNVLMIFRFFSWTYLLTPCIDQVSFWILLVCAPNQVSKTMASQYMVLSFILICWYSWYSESFLIFWILVFCYSESFSSCWNWLRTAVSKIFGKAFFVLMRNQWEIGLLRFATTYASLQS